MKHGHFPALMLVCTGLLAACSMSPKPGIRYRSADPQAFLEHGLSMQRTQSGPLTFTAGFLEYKPDPVPDYSGPGPITFLVRVENVSDRARPIDPEDFRIALPGESDSLAALDPETLIREAREEIAAQAEGADHQRNSPVAVKPPKSPWQMLAGYMLETPEEKERENAAALERERREAWNESVLNNALAEAEMRETVWSASALRKTLLAPGERIEGRVGFAPGLYAHAPDTLLLRFRMADGSFLDLGRFARVIQ